MGSVEKSLIKFLIVAVTLLLGITFSLHFFPVEYAFATEEYIHPSEMDFSDAGANPLIGYALLAATLLAAIPSVVYVFRKDEQKRLQSSSSIEIEGQIVRIIGSNENVVEKVRKTAKPTPALVIIMTIFNVFVVIGVSSSAPSFPINISSFFMALLSVFSVAATYSGYFLIKSAHVLIFPDGKIWYRTLMRTKPDEFYVKDIGFIEEQKIDYTLHLKCGKVKNLNWLSSPPELKEYLIEQGIPTKDKG